MMDDGLILPVLAELGVVQGVGAIVTDSAYFPNVVMIATLSETISRL